MIRMQLRNEFEYKKKIFILLLTFIFYIADPQEDDSRRNKTYISR